MYEKVLPQLWMLLSRPQRLHLAKVFAVPHTGVSEVKDETVISDGHTADDLHAITAEKMELYVGSKETFPRLWELTVAKCHYELNPPIGVIKGADVETPFDDTLSETGAFKAPIDVADWQDVVGSNGDASVAAKPKSNGKKAKSK